MEQQVGTTRIVMFTSDAEAGAEPGRKDRQDRAEGPDPGKSGRRAELCSKETLMWSDPCAS